MIYHIQVIREAVSRMSPGFVKTHAQIPWAKIVAMRNLLIHAYFGVDLDEVWTVISKDLPELKKQIELIM